MLPLQQRLDLVNRQPRGMKKEFFLHPDLILPSLCKSNNNTRGVTFGELRFLTIQHFAKASRAHLTTNKYTGHAREVLHCTYTARASGAVRSTAPAVGKVFFCTNTRGEQTSPVLGCRVFLRSFAYKRAMWQRAVRGNIPLLPVKAPKSVRSRRLWCPDTDAVLQPRL